MTAVPLPWYGSAPSASSSPAAVPQPSPPPSPSPGIIQAATPAVTVADPAQGTQIPITAVGGDTTWHAWVSGPGAADVTLSPASGFLPDGTGGYIDLTIDATAQAAGGTVTVHVWPGDVMVAVTWAAVPAPVPSGAVTDVPTAAPSPAAS